MSSWNGFKLTKNGTEQTAKQLNILLRAGTANPILPPTRDRIMTIPGRDGVLYFTPDMGARRFSLPCVFVNASTAEALEAQAKALAAHLTDDGKPTKLELIFEWDKTVYYEVYYSGRSDLARGVFDGEFELQLIAPDPDAKAV